jgi:hypothetical protein
MQKNTMCKSVALRKLVWSSSLLLVVTCLSQDPPANRWIELRRDPLGGRRGSAIRYDGKEGRFILLGFMTPDMELLQENPLMEISEYDVVASDPAAG